MVYFNLNTLFVYHSVLKVITFLQNFIAVLWKILVILAAAVSSLYLFMKWRTTYWERRGLYTYYGKDSSGVKTYKNIKERGLKHGGFISLFNPCYMPVDLDIIKAILVTSSDHFVNRGLFSNPKVDPLTATLGHLTDGHWKYVRSTISPIFSSGKLHILLS